MNSIITRFDLNDDTVYEYRLRIYVEHYTAFLALTAIALRVSVGRLPMIDDSNSYNLELEFPRL